MDIKKPIIVLVDDDEIDRRAFERCLGDYNCKFVVCESAEQALPRLYEHKNSPLILVLDVNLPGVSGLEFLADIRQMSKIKHTVTFILSSSKRDEDVIEAHRLNVAGYLRKIDHSNMLQNLEFLKNYLAVNNFSE